MNRRQQPMGIWGFLGALFSSFRRPAVTTTEKVDIQTQITVPLGRAVSVGMFMSAGLLSALMLSWAIPPRVRYHGALGMAGGVLAILGLLSLFWRPGSLQEIIWRKGAFTFIALGMGMLTYVCVQNPGDWWFAGLDYRFLAAIRLFTFSGLIMGIVGTYYFIKESIVPWELTGLDRVLYSLLLVISDEIEDILRLQSGRTEKDVLDQVRREVGDALEHVRDHTTRPLVREMTYASELRAADQAFRLNLLSFLWLGGQIGFSRRDMTIKFVEEYGEKLHLPFTNLEISDPEYRKMMAHFKNARILVSETGMPTRLNEQFDPVTTLELLGRISLPKDRRPKDL